MIGQVYSICSRDATHLDSYIGSTKNLNKRIIDHKCKCANFGCKGSNMKVYKHIREHGGFDSWKFVVLETFEYKKKHELRARERHWIDLLKPTLNERIPNRTQK